MHKITPATPALPWATSMALATKREWRPRIGVSKPTKAASARHPAATSPKSPAGKPSLLPVPFKRTTRTSSAPRPRSKCNPIRNGFRMPRRCKTTRTSPSAMAARGSAINGNIGMSPPGQECELRSCAQNNLQGAVRAMAQVLFTGSRLRERRGGRRREIPSSGTHPDLSEGAFYIRFDDHLWSMRTPAQPIIAALPFNPNQQARTL